MKLSCTPISLARTIREGQMDLHSFIRFCAGQQIEGIDLMDSKAYPWLWKSPSDLNHAAQWAREQGLVIAAYACGNNFAKTSDEEFDQQVDLVKNAIEEAACCGAPLLRIFGGYHHETGGDPEMGYALGMSRVMEGISRCLDLAQSHRVVLALENHGRLPGHSYEMAAILDHFDSPWLKLTFDPANFLANNMDEVEDPLRAYARLKGRIAHVHVKDFGPAKLDPTRRVEPCLPGAGLTPLRQFLFELEKDQFSGFCSLEYEASRVMPELEGVPFCFDYFKDIRKLNKILMGGSLSLAGQGN